MPGDVTAFLAAQGWADAAHTPITPDWSPRRTTRLRRDDGATAILVHAPVAIPGHGLEDFARLGDALRALGLSAPRIYASAPDLLLTEDFGDTPIDTQAIERAGYETAVDVLQVLRGAPVDGLDAYHDGYIYKKLALFSPDAGWMQAWRDAEAALPPCPFVFGHMDYKAGNLHWLPEREGAARLGLLDYQAAQDAPFTYDIVNLLEDARRDLAPDLKAALKQRFHDALPDAWKRLFEGWYAVTAAQFHARVLGQIQGRDDVAPDVAPRLRAYLRHEINHDALAPVRAWCETHKVHFQ